MPRYKEDDPNNADAPYDGVEIVKDGNGELQAKFYMAAERDPGLEPLHSLETLMDRQKHFHGEGRSCPVTDKAIRLLRQAMNLPELH